tara:strand:+ start:586 stop:993 length:408 start_codon:yes stop_codon:yes gene_type:complete
MSWTNQYVGVPYVEHGRSTAGWDCWGLLCAVYRDQLQIELPSYSTRYTDTIDNIDSAGIGGAFAEEVADWQVVEEPAVFDAVWCRMVGIECHVGVYVGSGIMLHALSGCDTCLVRIDMTGWRRRVQRCYRHILAS